MPSFYATGEQLKRFFELATINFNIHTIAVDVLSNTLFTSALIEKGKHCWAMVQGRVNVEEDGSFAVNVEDIKKFLSVSKPSTTYLCSTKDNELTIRSETTRMSIHLSSFENHTDPENSASSYVQPHPQAEGKRYRIGIEYIDDIPLAIRPPNSPDEKRSTIEKVIAVDPSLLKSQVKIANSFGVEGLRLQTSGEHLVVIIASNHISHEEKVATSSVTESTINWDETFRSPIKDIFSLANESIYLGMTENRTPMINRRTGDAELGPNFGLWTVIQEEENTACYWLGPVEE